MKSASERGSALRDPRLPDITAIDSLKMMLDYAMAEGSELGLPVFVGLLNEASLELGRSGTCPPTAASRQSSHRAKRAAS